MPVERLTRLVTKLSGHQILRFLVVGGFNTLFSYGIYTLLIWFGLHFALATSLQLTASVFINYLTFGNLVFCNSGKGALWRFSLVCIGQYLVYTMGIWILVERELSKYFAGAIMIVPVVVLSYLLNKHFAFRPEAEKRNKTKDCKR